MRLAKEFRELARLRKNGSDDPTQFTDIGEVEQCKHCEGWETETNESTSATEDRGTTRDRGTTVVGGITHAKFRSNQPNRAIMMNAINFCAPKDQRLTTLSNGQLAMVRHKRKPSGGQLLQVISRADSVPKLYKELAKKNRPEIQLGLTIGAMGRKMAHTEKVKKQKEEAASQAPDDPLLLKKLEEDAALIKALKEENALLRNPDDVIKTLVAERVELDIEAIVQGAIKGGVEGAVKGGIEGALEGAIAINAAAVASKLHDGVSNSRPAAGPPVANHMTLSPYPVTPLPGQWGPQMGAVPQVIPSANAMQQPHLGHWIQKFEHRCAICGRVRSHRFQHKHRSPIAPGDKLAICAKCWPEVTVDEGRIVTGEHDKTGKKTRADRKLPRNQGQCKATEDPRGAEQESEPGYDSYDSYDCTGTAEDSEDVAHEMWRNRLIDERNRGRHDRGQNRGRQAEPPASTSATVNRVDQSPRGRRGKYPAATPNGSAEVVPIVAASAEKLVVEANQGASRRRRERAQLDSGLARPADPVILRPSLPSDLSSLNEGSVLIVEKYYDINSRNPPPEAGSIRSGEVVVTRDRFMGPFHHNTARRSTHDDPQQVSSHVRHTKSNPTLNVEHLRLLPDDSGIDPVAGKEFFDFSSPEASVTNSYHERLDRRTGLSMSPRKEDYEMRDNLEEEYSIAAKDAYHPLDGYSHGEMSNSRQLLAPGKHHDPRKTVSMELETARTGYLQDYPKSTPTRFRQTFVRDATEDGAEIQSSSEDSRQYQPAVSSPGQPSYKVRHGAGNFYPYVRDSPESMSVETMEPVRRESELRLPRVRAPMDSAAGESSTRAHVVRAPPMESNRREPRLRAPSDPFTDEPRWREPLGRAPSMSPLIPTMESYGSRQSMSRERFSAQGSEDGYDYQDATPRLGYPSEYSSTASRNLSPIASYRSSRAGRSQTMAQMPRLVDENGRALVEMDDSEGSSNRTVHRSVDRSHGTNALGLMTIAQRGAYERGSDSPDSHLTVRRTPGREGWMEESPSIDDFGGDYDGPQSGRRGDIYTPMRHPQSHRRNALPDESGRYPVQPQTPEARRYMHPNQGLYSGVSNGSWDSRASRTRESR